MDPLDPFSSSELDDDALAERFVVWLGTRSIKQRDGVMADVHDSLMRCENGDIIGLDTSSLSLLHALAHIGRQQVRERERRKIAYTN